MIIVVNSHRRSGTHFLIDTILQNCPQAVFPCKKKLPADFNLGSLLRKSDDIFDVFKLEIKRQPLLVIKNHNLHYEYAAITPTDKHEELLQEVMNSAQHLYIHRDPIAVMDSLYRYSNSDLVPSEFVRQANDHFAINKKVPGQQHESKPRYLGFHVEDWLSAKGVYGVRFEELRNDFTDTAKGVFRHLGIAVRDKIEEPKLPKFSKIHQLAKLISNFSSMHQRSTSVKPGKGLVDAGMLTFTHDDSIFIKKEYEIGRRLRNNILNAVD